MNQTTHNPGGEGRSGAGTLLATANGQPPRATSAPHLAMGDTTAALAHASRGAEASRSAGAYEDLVEHLAVGVFRITADDEGLIVDFNPAFMRLFEAGDHGDLLGRCATMLHADPERRRHYVNQLLLAQRVHHMEVELVTLKGRTFPASITASIRRIGGRDYIEGVIEDITEKRLRDAERKQAETNERELAMTRTQMRLVREIQQRMLPPGAPPLPGYDLAGATFPAEIVGGDYFDYIPFTDGRLGIVIGDATGHGLGSALLMAETRSYLWALAQTCHDLDELLRRSNSLLHAGTPDACFVTLIVAMLDPATGDLEVCNCGHPTAYLVDGHGNVRTELPSTTCPLGCVAQWDAAPTHRLRMRPGDRLLLLTDGVMEARNTDGHFLGTDRAVAAACCHAHLDSLPMINSIYEDVCDYCRADPNHDDMTMVVLRRLPT